MTTAADRALAALAAAHHGIIRLDDAIANGLGRDERRRRLSAGAWVAPYKGVYRLAGAPVTWRGELLSACWAGGERAAASHRSAAALWEFPGRRTDVTEITCPRWRRAQHRGLIVHETKVLDPADVTMVDGIPVTTPERTLLDLGAVQRRLVVEMALDNALRRDLTTHVALRGLLQRLGRRGRNGVGCLRAILDERVPEQAVPESEMETKLRRVLRGNGLPDPVPQYEVLDHGRFVARVDFAYPDRKIAIEYDSYQEHTGKLALVHDSARRNALLALGWTPLTATAEDVRQGGSRLAAAIRQIARRAG